MATPNGSVEFQQYSTPSVSIRQPVPAKQPPPPPDFLSLSWLTCVCCNFLCLGTMAVLSASQSKTLAEKGDMALAARRGQEAKKMAVHGICFTMLVWIIVLIILVIRLVNDHKS